MSHGSAPCADLFPGYRFSVVGRFLQVDKFRCLMERYRFLLAILLAAKYGSCTPAADLEQSSFGR